MNKMGLFVLIAFGLLLTACAGKKKKNMSGNGDITVQDLIEFYPEISLPFIYSDSSFPAKENDSLLINSEVLYKYTADSLLRTIFDSTANPGFYAIGKFSNGTEETYLLTRGVSRSKRVMLITAYDKDKKYIAGIPIIKLDKSASRAVSITIDSRFNISKNVVHTMPGDIVVQGNDVYVLNKAAKKFMLVMTDSLGEATGPLLNPIDTLSKSGKYAGDYGDGKRNLISIRDGKRHGKMEMFVHLESKKDFECSGEIKGEIVFTSANMAEYRQGGDPCVLQFIFSDKYIKIQEVQGCGSRLGALQCSFNGVYPKHTLAKPGIERKAITPRKKT